eukprot:4401662-Prymnesium_polylepis.3
MPAPVSRDRPAHRCPQCCSPVLWAMLHTMHTLAHDDCACLARESTTPLSAALQPIAAVAAPSAMHAQNERDSHRAECCARPT